MVSEGVGANTQHSHAHHTVMMAWFWLFTPLGGIATCSFLLCRSPLGDYMCACLPVSCRMLFRTPCCTRLRALDSVRNAKNFMNLKAKVHKRIGRCAAAAVPGKK